ncbi:alpha/beta hydrolase [Actinoplanes sp. NPDC051861]|uniref:alpha/beta fold hydrolase n=1 Tax=Actinoplanes sp. NPDC051861 TaxID=3155170 RepID=UPI0034196FB8
MIETRFWSGDTELAWTDSGGDGDPLLLIHGGGLADWFTPMAAEPALKRHRVIRMVRAGYTGAPVPGGLTVGDFGDHAAAVLRQLGTGPAHVVAHSSGSAVALQLAVDHPELVRTLSLCEPPLLDALVAPEDLAQLHAVLGPAIGAAMAAVARGDVAAAFEAFMTPVCGPDHRRVMESVLGVDVVSPSAYFFTGEMPAVGAWDVDLARVRVRVLLVLGTDSPPPVHRLVARLAGLIPGASVATIAGAGHLMPLTHAAELSRVIDAFCHTHARA